MLPRGTIFLQLFCIFKFYFFLIFSKTLNLLLHIFRLLELTSSKRNFEIQFRPGLHREDKLSMFWKNLEFLRNYGSEEAVK